MPVQGVHIQCSPVFQGVGMDLLGVVGEKEALGFKGDMNVQTSSVIAINAVLLMVVNSRAITPNLSTQRKSPKTIQVSLSFLSMSFFHFPYRKPTQVINRRALTKHY